ncbi:MAG: S-layer protein [Theionarchaea archaeon]|nr:S-layer protein [Theionarchaea archaeon]
MSCGRNLILIGGSVAKAIVKELVTEGISLENWEESPGEWKYIAAPYGMCDVLIVGGKDQMLLEKLRKPWLRAELDC